MATTLIVENGAGTVDANSYVDVSHVDFYAERYGDTSWTSLQASTKRTAIIQATRFVEVKFGARYKGSILVDGQGLLFPRTEFVDNNGRVINAGTIPNALKDAVSKVAIYYTINNSLPFIPTSDNNIKKKSVSIGGGAVQESIEYFEKEEKTVYDEFEFIISSILLPKQSNSFQSTVTRG